MTNHQFFFFHLKDIPTPRCSSSVLLANHISTLGPRLDQMLKFFGSPRQRGLKFYTYGLTQKALITAGNQITLGNPNTVVAFGDGQFSSTSRGHPPGPVKKLFKFMKANFPNVRKVWEHRTSIVCSRCEGPLTMLKKEVWALKICETTCLTIWNRDVNAARNIRQLFLDMNLNGGDRPLTFSIQ